MRALVIGAKGFVGAALVRELLRRGHEVTALDLRGGPGRLADVADRINWCVGDGSSEETILDAIGRNRIESIYYGPFYRAERGAADLDKELSVMAIAAWRVFQLARGLGLQRIVFPSSTAVHGYQPDDGSAVSETTRVGPQPHQLYGAYKLLSEQVGIEINTALGRNVICSVRLPAIYGPGAQIASRRVNVPAVSAVAGQPGRVDYAPEARLCIAHVTDAAALLATIMETRDIDHALYEGGGIDVSFGEISDAVNAITAGSQTVFGTDTRPILPHLVDWSRARHEFGISHRSLAAGMESVIEYERERLLKPVNLHDPGRSPS